MNNVIKRQFNFAVVHDQRQLWPGGALAHLYGSSEPLWRRIRNNAAEENQKFDHKRERMAGENESRRWAGNDYNVLHVIVHGHVRDNRDIAVVFLSEDAADVVQASRHHVRRRQLFQAESNLGCWEQNEKCETSTTVRKRRREAAAQDSARQRCHRCIF